MSAGEGEPTAEAPTSAAPAGHLRDPAPHLTPDAAASAAPAGHLSDPAPLLPARRLPPILLGLIVLCVVLAAAWLRQRQLGDEALHRAQQALQAAEAHPTAAPTGAVSAPMLEHLEQLRFALGAYVPGGATSRTAADRLWAIAQRAHEQGDRATALAALRRLRGGLRAIRWLGQPHADLVAPTDALLAELTAEEQLAQGDAGTIRGRDLAQLTADHAHLLALDPLPSPARSLAVVLSFIGWLGGAALTIRRGFTPDLRARRRPLLAWGLATAAAFVLWLLALSQVA